MIIATATAAGLGNSDEIKFNAFDIYFSLDKHKYILLY